MLSVYQKIEKCLNALQADAYQKNGKFTGRGKNRKASFVPCAKAIAMIEARRKHNTLTEILGVGALAHCGCHNDKSESDLFDLCFD